MTLPRTAIAGVLAAAAVTVAAAPQQTPTFKSGTQVVEVDVRVFDRDGHFVTGLTPADFDLREDGVSQPIVSLTLIGPRSPQSTGREAPSAPSAPAPAAPSARSAPSAPTAATFLFLFDTLHLSPAGLNRSRGAVLDFVNQRLRQGDLAGVIADGKMINNRLTTDREEVARAVDSIRLPGEMASLERDMKRTVPRFVDEYEVYRIVEMSDEGALDVAVRRGCEDDPTLCRVMPDLVRGKARDIDARVHDLSRLTLTTLRALAHGLARMSGPKTVVYVSEGFMFWNVQSELREAVGEMNRAGAHIYAIDARGLNKGHNAGLLTATNPGDPLAGQRFDEQIDALNSLAVDTGGLLIQNENNIGRALDEIQQDAGTYYVLGYTPSNQAFDGKFRAIGLSVKRPGVTVRARKGYLALEPAKLLRPATIPPAPPPAAAASAAVSAGADATVPDAAAPSPAVSAEAVRTRIDRDGLVATLRGNDPVAASDAAALGLAAYQKGDVESAERELTRAAADPAAHPWVHYMLGLCHLALGVYPEAAVSWERVRSAVPAFEPVYFNLADAYLLRGDDASAVRVLADASVRWPSDAEVYDATGVIQLRAHAFADAIESFRKATRLAPKDPLGFYNLASAHHANYLRLRRPTPTSRQFMVSARERDLAIDAYRKVVKLNEQYVDEAKKGLSALDVEK
jgi:VWFA-related protein